MPITLTREDDGQEIDVDIGDIMKVESEGSLMRVHFRGGQSGLFKHLPAIVGVTHLPNAR